MAALLLCTLGWPAKADWREDIGIFRVGILAEPGSGNTIEGLSELNEAFGRALGMKVEFFVASSYAALIDAQISSRIDYAVYSAAAYAAAYRRCECIEPLVAPTGEDGTIGIRSLLIARDGRLASTDDLARHKIALSPSESIAGHQLPLASFGTDDDQRLSGAETFLVHAQSAEAAEEMLADGRVDALFGWMPVAPDGSGVAGGTIDRLVSAGMERERLSVVWRSDVLRYGPHAVSITLDADAKDRLRTFMTQLRKTGPDIYERIERRRIGGFVAVLPEDYALALRMVETWR